MFLSESRCLSLRLFASVHGSFVLRHVSWNEVDATTILVWGLSPTFYACEV